MNSDKFYIRKDCRLCGSKDLVLGVPLRPIPMVSPNIDDKTPELHGLLHLHSSIDLYRCEDCGLMQLTTVLDPNFQYDTFMYQTSISLGLQQHFYELAQVLTKNISSPNELSILEIGSNDGTLLDFFQQKGVQVVGVDPAKKIANAATEKGILTYADFFTQKLAKKIVKNHGQMDIIISNNTLANLDNLTDMIEGIRDCIKPDGLFVFETQYALDVLENLLLDVIYHEHLTYFSIKPLVSFFNAKGFKLIKVERIGTKGGSVRVYVQLKDGCRAVEASVSKMINLEESKGLYTDAIYNQFSTRIHRISEQITDVVKAAKEQKGEVAIYGSSVGCASLINQFDLGNYVDFIVDDNPFKRELVGSNYKIKIVNRAELAIRNPSLVVILAWRYAKVICEQNKAYLMNGGKFLIPLPEVSVVTDAEFCILENS